MGKKSRQKQLNRVERQEQHVIKKMRRVTWTIMSIAIIGVLTFGSGIGYLIYKKVSNKKLPDTKNEIVEIETAKGNIYFELLASAAPKTVENFKKLAGEHFYDGTTFHRVIADFMIQGGDPLSKDTDPSNDGTGGPGYKFNDEINPWALNVDPATIKTNIDAGYQYDHNLPSVKNTVGAVAMANSGPNTNGSQFFIITTKDQPHLDGKHTVFGHVIDGLDVANKITQGDVMKSVRVISLDEKNAQTSKQDLGNDPGKMAGPNDTKQPDVQVGDIKVQTETGTPVQVTPVPVKPNPVKK